MDKILVAAQLVLALGILNVWLVRYKKATDWRGGGAQSMSEEFAVYGLPSWFLGVVGILKIAFATLLIAGLWVPALTKPAALGLALLMMGAMAMHMKVKDPAKRSVPAAIMFLLCAVVIYG